MTKYNEEVGLFHKKQEGGFNYCKKITPEQYFSGVMQSLV
jgi:hypothetical protein